MPCLRDTHALGTRLVFLLLCYLACPVAMTHRPETTEIDDQIIRSIMLNSNLYRELRPYQGTGTSISGGGGIPPQK